MPTIPVPQGDAALNVWAKALESAIQTERCQSIRVCDRCGRRDSNQKRSVKMFLELWTIFAILVIHDHIIIFPYIDPTDTLGKTTKG